MQHDTNCKFAFTTIFLNVFDIDNRYNENTSETNKKIKIVCTANEKHLPRHAINYHSSNSLLIYLFIEINNFWLVLFL